MKTDATNELTTAAAPPRIAVENVDVWRVRWRQTWEVIKIEWRKILLSRRAIPIYLLALAPPVLFAVTAVMLKIYPPRNVRFDVIGQAPAVYAVVFQTLILNVTVFFGCAWIFMNLFRGETVDRSLHYYFLTPLRREVLVVAKFFAGVTASATVFSLSALTAMFFLLATRTNNAFIEYLTHGGGLRQALVYAGVTCLACAGYGAAFLVIGLVFRNPILPALTIYGWEAINFLLPPLLKRLSVTFYLRSLVPLKVSEGKFEYLAEPLSTFASITGLTIFVIVMLGIAAWRARQMEINYGNE